MKKNLVSQALHSAVVVTLIVSACIAISAHVSCRLTEEGIEIVPADTTVPSVLSFSVAASDSLLISCSEKVKLDDVSVLDSDGKSFAVANDISYSEDKKSVEVKLSALTSVGKSYVFSGVLSDMTGNSLSYSQKFCGYNENPARLIINEIRTSYNKDKACAEYVEFFVLKGGNTYGLELVSGYNGENKKYVFPAIEVSKGEYITLHGRTFENYEDLSVDELGDNLDLSSAPESQKNARDLWKAGNEKIVSLTDVVVLRNWETGVLKDAVFLSASGKTDWSRTLIKDFAKSAVDAGLWLGEAGPENSICSDGMKTSLLRSASRQNTNRLAAKYAEGVKIPDIIPTSPDDWMITEKVVIGTQVISGATPGYANSSNPL